ncbi:MAG TPA: DUF1684 domain-containing protein [Gemmatimonadales bacterium]|nr:DUF1684 domain-containing protein [Gemmatimonadales bacterium]
MSAPLRFALAAAVGIAGAVWPLAAGGQSRTAVEQERREFAKWLRAAPLSPRRAVGVVPIGAALSFGPPTAAVPLSGIAAGELVEREGRLVLRSGASEQALVRGRGVALGAWHLLASGAPGHSVVTVFAAELRTGKEPSWFPYDPQAAAPVTLIPAPVPATLRLLAPDGTEVEASEAGSVSLRLEGKAETLRVRRIPGVSDEESELEIFFRDATSGRTTYPAGRFVALIPLGGDRYLLDFNRARNPFCAYNTAYPCPAPWRGNALPLAIRAGERYLGGGFEPSSRP